MHADGWIVIGRHSIAQFVDGLSPIEHGSTSVELAVCYDVSAVDVLDAEGESVVVTGSPGRPELDRR